jgi:hypothetical protein
LEEYLSNCTEGLEKYTYKRAFELLEFNRTHGWRIRLLGELPEGLFDFIFAECRRLGKKPPQLRGLANIALALRDGNKIESEHCPNCGMPLRFRQRVPRWLAEIVDGWINQNIKQDDDPLSGEQQPNGGAS